MVLRASCRSAPTRRSLGHSVQSCCAPLLPPTVGPQYVQRHHALSSYLRDTTLDRRPCDAPCLIAVYFYPLRQGRGFAQRRIKVRLTSVEWLDPTFSRSVSRPTLARVTA